MLNISLLVLGGGGGGAYGGDGGGGGLYDYTSSLELASNQYVITVGGGGGGGAEGNEDADPGEESVFGVGCSEDIIKTGAGGLGGKRAIVTFSSVQSHYGRASFNLTGHNRNNNSIVQISSSDTVYNGTYYLKPDGIDAFFLSSTPDDNYNNYLYFSNGHTAGGTAKFYGSGGGENATAGGTTPGSGKGGDGYNFFAITGSEFYAAAGGGGGACNGGVAGAGGEGGGGDADPDGEEGLPGEDGLGGGGAGGGIVGGVSYSGSNGGSGCVIIRFLTTDISSSTGGSKTVDGDYTVVTFNESGVFEYISALSHGFDIRVELYDSTDTRAALLQDSIIDNNINWTFRRFGGCGDCSLSLLRGFSGETTIGAESYIKIYIDSGFGVWDHIYTGMVLETIKGVDSQDRETLDLRCSGIAFQLRNIIVGAKDILTYGSFDKTISEIVKDLVEHYISPYTGILYSSSYIDTAASPQLQSAITIQSTAEAAIDMLAKMAGNWEWGVDKNGYFYFKAATGTDVCKMFYAGGVVKSYTENINFDGVKNRVLVPSENFLDIYEAAADMALEQQSTGYGDQVNVGHSTSVALKQSFKTDKSSISKIVIKAIVGGAGSADLLTDGDMELSGTANWTKYLDTTVIAKTSGAHSNGVKALQIYAPVATGSAYQALSSCAEGRYRLEYSLYTNDKWRVFAKDNTGAILAEQTINKTKTWTKQYLVFTAPAGLTYIRIYFEAVNMNCLCNLDDVHCYGVGRQLYGHLVNDSTNELLAPACPGFSLDDGANNEWAFYPSYCGCDNDGDITYAFLISNYIINDFTFATLPPVNDSAYWIVYYSTSGSITNGAAKHYHDSAWSAVTGALYFKQYYNTSIELYGLREEIIQGLAGSGVSGMREYADAYLAAVSQPVKQISLNVEPLAVVIDGHVPNSGIGLVHYYDPEAPVAATVNNNTIDTIHYSITENGLSITITAGQKLPNVAYRIKMIENKFANSILV